ncbi:Acyl-CoA N-acyltransferase (NAT) superfamily protein [Forsythia ovata]|uniref:Acyl-CoA N-acyltransferase (NAT) superfamily protein n=1 Tax=Forsythia ovata TaxID=205694 RepID=A0ABD1WMQ9_9LAMI
MAVTTAVHGCYFPSKINSLSLPLKITGQIKQSSPPPPIFISTNPAHVNLHHLKDLYTLCNHSCHRFPNVDHTGKVEAIDVGKLRTAIFHSSIVVTVFTKPEFVTGHSSPVEVTNLMGIGGDWIKRVMPVTPDNGLLVGFGRAVSDFGLTASIYDVMVFPALQGRGIGRMIVQKIVRMLTNRDIYDIAALCSGKERLFFRACGFGDDILGSTTMMYTRNSSYSIDEKTISVGRKQLLVPLQETS